MMSITHISIATAGAAMALGTANPWVLLTAAVASQIPDIDSTQSIVGRMFYPLASWLENRYPHRGPTHSFISTMIIGLTTLPLIKYFHWHFWAAIVLGQFLGWFADSFTKAGVQAFWPDDAWLVIPGNPRSRLDTHSPAEYWIMATAILLLILSVNISSTGGVSEVFAAMVFQNSESAAQQFQKYGSQQRIFAIVTGTNTATGQAINEAKYEVIDTSGLNVLGEDSTGKIYKIGNSADVQINAIRVKTHQGESLVITSEQLNPEEIPVEEWLTTVPRNAYLSGSLLLDDAGEIRLNAPIDRYATIVSSGGGITLSNARPGEVYEAVGEFWILSGSVIAKVRL